MKKYNKKIWLNRDKSASTGSLVIYQGTAPWNANDNTRFIEISDCQNSIRLHMSKVDKLKDWKFKVEKLADELNEYVKFLKDTE